MKKLFPEAADSFIKLLLKDKNDKLIKQLNNKKKLEKKEYYQILKNEQLTPQYLYIISAKWINKYENYIN